jgi:RNA polymerase sigma-70 factor (ECF subfamily)
MGLDKGVVVQVLLRERIRLSGSVMPIVRDGHAVDDLFQQVVLKALQGCDHFTEPEHVLAWALRAIRHRAVDLVRSRKAQCLDDAVLDLLEQHWARSSTHEIIDRVEALQHCLGKLPERSRSLLRLRYEDGLPCAGVAGRLRQSVEAVYQSLSRLHHQLRLCIEQRLAASGQLTAVAEQSLGGA